MKEEKLIELLEKYYNGDSSIDEENLLKEYFAGSDILPRYNTEKDFFRCYSAISETSRAASEDLEMRILQSIDKHDKRHRNPFVTSRYFVPLSLAASLLIIVGIYFFFIHRSEPADTYSDPVIAYAETMKILNEVSSKLNKGTSELYPVSKMYSATRESFESIDRSALIMKGGFERIKLIDKLSDTVLQTRKINNQQKNIK